MNQTTSSSSSLDGFIKSFKHFKNISKFNIAVIIPQHCRIKMDHKKKERRYISTNNHIAGDEKEKRQHVNAIHRISIETGVTYQDVTILYEEILARYRSDARIKDYLSILVSREVKDILSSNKR